ncbi:hypothetical protein [Dietzia timorensis]|uniref:Uncharacterized protein n=1 Tax=Dietzia timorensis TaxID=499555 RepID=A0A173LGC4_9ACTN|nr:hypothetical protein [Dietzia timorensis]ANI91366.1 Hypothetical protein BJL86_0563 [Dietzia timorensis]
MSGKIIRKNLLFSEKFYTQLLDFRIAWHIEDPSRMKALNGLASESSFVEALLDLAIELSRQPENSARLWDLIQLHEIESKKTPDG